MPVSEKTRDILYLLSLIREGTRLSAAGAVEGAVRLQKLVFLAREEGVPFGYHFNSHFRGPFSRELARDLDLLVDLGFVEVVRGRGFSATGRPIEKRSYRLTSEGERFLSRYSHEIDEEHLDKIKGIVAKYVDAEISDLVEESLRRWLVPAKES